MRQAILFLPVLLLPALTKALFLQPPAQLFQPTLALPRLALPWPPGLRAPVRHVWNVLSAVSDTAFKHRALNQWDTSLDELRRCVDVQAAGDCVVAPLRGAMSASLLLSERFARFAIPSPRELSNVLAAVSWRPKKKRNMLPWR